MSQSVVLVQLAVGCGVKSCVVLCVVRVGVVVVALEVSGVDIKVDNFVVCVEVDLVVWGLNVLDDRVDGSVVLVVISGALVVTVVVVFNIVVVVSLVEGLVGNCVVEAVLVTGSRVVGNNLSSDGMLPAQS